MTPIYVFSLACFTNSCLPKCTLDSKLKENKKIYPIIWMLIIWSQDKIFHMHQQHSCWCKCKILWWYLYSKLQVIMFSQLFFGYLENVGETGPSLEPLPPWHSAMDVPASLAYSEVCRLIQWPVLILCGGSQKVACEDVIYLVIVFKVG